MNMPKKALSDLKVFVSLLKGRQFLIKEFAPLSSSVSGGNCIPGKLVHFCLTGLPLKMKTGVWFKRAVSLGSLDTP